METQREEGQVEAVTQDIEVYEAPSAGAALAVSPTVTAGDLVRRLDVIKQAMEQAMVRDTDYGVIPGTNKPALLKPGAEKLGALFQLDIQLENEKIWHQDGHLTVMSHAVVYHQPTGTRLGAGEGLCTTREAKYAWRTQDRLCPQCGKPNVRKGAAKNGRPGNWYCWQKTGGCGATWALGSEQGKTFEAMETGRVANPDLPDTFNTVVKMAEKRARVDGVLAVTGASALFSQDVEDTETVSDGAQAAQPVRVPAQGQSEAQTGAPAAVQMVTERQLPKIHAIRTKLIDAGKFSQEQFEAQLLQDYGVDSTKGLTKAEASELIERLSAVEATL